MADVVVTVPKNFTHPDAPGLKGLAAWLAEGDPPGSEWSGDEWEFTTWGLWMSCPSDFTLEPTASIVSFAILMARFTPKQNPALSATITSMSGPPAPCASSGCAP